MKIKWYGQSAFLLTTDEGSRILIDPYGKLLGYRMPKGIESDIVIVSHNHKDHNQIQVASGEYMLVNQAKSYTKKDVSITGIPTFHDKVGGKKRGPNIVFVIRTGDLTICHCGDLGHLLTEEQIRQIGPVDILIVPAGGKMVLNGTEAAEVRKQLNPVITIPMHYRTKALGLPGKLLFDKVDSFITAANQPAKEVKELEVTKERLSDYAGIVTFRYD
ncbi:MBL fold metallo-hydrolase [Paenibacillus glycanilyticus]|uniref:MBL fold metallo-hydrolase n=1 Tax=Paenibacillus glycanilyticus TaxID=126569 RepID=A0ABQ6G600_9BACL|nr:MBL fold metallo-hydrolase [Paenibacillus glycanilyticus]GLX66414.1 MBL fold metallo-hydrolase [Paenibacillus glycanilyticus]